MSLSKRPFNSAEATTLVTNLVSFKELLTASGMQMDKATFSFLYTNLATVIQKNLSKIKYKEQKAVVKEKSQKTTAEDSKVIEIEITNAQVKRFNETVQRLKLVTNLDREDLEKLVAAFPVIQEYERILKSETEQILLPEAHEGIQKLLQTISKPQEHSNADAKSTEKVSDEKESEDSESLDAVESLKAMLSMCKSKVELPAGIEKYALSIFKECQQVFTNNRGEEEAVPDEAVEKVKSFIEEKITLIGLQSEIDALTTLYEYQPVTVTKQNKENIQSILNQCEGFITSEQFKATVPTMDAQKRADQYFKKEHEKLFPKQEDEAKEVFVDGLIKLKKTFNEILVKFGANRKQVNSTFEPFFAIFASAFIQEFESVLNNDNEPDAELQKNFSRLNPLMSMLFFEGPNSLIIPLSDLVSGQPGDKVEILRHFELHDKDVLVKQILIIMSEELPAKYLEIYKKEHLKNILEKCLEQLGDKSKQLKDQISQMAVDTASQIEKDMSDHQVTVNELLSKHKDAKLTDQQQQDLQEIKVCQKDIGTKQQELKQKLGDADQIISTLPLRQQQAYQARIEKLRETLNSRLEEKSRYDESMGSAYSTIETMDKARSEVMENLASECKSASQFISKTSTTIRKKGSGFAGVLDLQESKVFEETERFSSQLFDHKASSAVEPLTEAEAEDKVTRAMYFSELANLKKPVSEYFDKKMDKLYSESRTEAVEMFKQSVDEAKAQLKEGRFLKAEYSSKYTIPAFESVVKDLSPTRDRMLQIKGDVATVEAEIVRLNKEVQEQAQRNELFKQRIAQFDQSVFEKYKQKVEDKKNQENDSQIEIESGGISLAFDMDFGQKGRLTKPKVFPFSRDGVPNIPVTSTTQVADTFRSLADEFESEGIVFGDFKVPSPKNSGKVTSATPSDEKSKGTKVDSEAVSPSLVVSGGSADDDLSKYTRYSVKNTDDSKGLVSPALADPAKSQLATVVVPKEPEKPKDPIKPADPVVKPEEQKSKATTQAPVVYKDLDADLGKDVHELAAEAARLYNELDSIKNKALVTAFEKIEKENARKPKEKKEVVEKPKADSTPGFFSSLFGSKPKEKPVEKKSNERLIIELFEKVGELANKPEEFIALLQNILDQIEASNPSFQMKVTEQGLLDIKNIQPALLGKGKSVTKDQLDKIKKLTPEKMRVIIDSAAAQLIKFVSDPQEKFKILSYFLTTCCPREIVQVTDENAVSKLVAYKHQLRTSKERMRHFLELGLNYYIDQQTADAKENRDVTSRFATPVTRNYCDSIEIHIEFFRNIYLAVGNEEKVDELNAFFTTQLNEIKADIVNKPQEDNDGKLRRLIKEFGFNCKVLGVTLTSNAEDGSITMNYRARLEQARMIALVTAMTYLNGFDQIAKQEKLVAEVIVERKQYIKAFLKNVLNLKLTDDSGKALSGSAVFARLIKEFTAQTEIWKQMAALGVKTSAAPVRKPSSDSIDNPFAMYATKELKKTAGEKSKSGDLKDKIAQAEKSAKEAQEKLLAAERATFVNARLSEQPAVQADLVSLSRKLHSS